jgi:hypothetical protein
MADVQCKKFKVTAVDLKITVPQPAKGTVAALPSADFLIVTWTSAETGAMATAFGKGSYHSNGADDTNLTQLILPKLPALPTSNSFMTNATRSRRVLRNRWPSSTSLCASLSIPAACLRWMGSA